MNPALFMVVLAISFIVVRIGAIAFQITGLEWSLAKFQSLSCFTGTGFTTKEAELITGNARRRQIASVLMVLGNAGLVIMIATFANSLQGAVVEIPVLDRFIPGKFLPLVNLAIIGVGLYVLYRILTNSKIARILTTYLRRKVIKTEKFKRVSFEELVVATGGYGVSKVQVTEGNPVANKKIIDADLRRRDITVLAIIRGNKTFANPRAESKMIPGDELICFGRLQNIKDGLRLDG